MLLSPLFQWHEDRWDSGNVCALVRHTFSNGKKEGVGSLLRDKVEEVLGALEVLDHLLCAVVEGADGALLQWSMLASLC